MHSNNISSEIHIIISCENVNNERDDFNGEAPRGVFLLFYVQMYKYSPSVVAAFRHN